VAIFVQPLLLPTAFPMSRVLLREHNIKRYDVEGTKPYYR
jgi:hypothetical protein